MTRLFNEVAADPVGWIVSGLVCCMVAHAIMIPTGMEHWLEGLLTPSA